MLAYSSHRLIVQHHWQVHDGGLRRARHRMFCGQPTICDGRCKSGQRSTRSRCTRKCQVGSGRFAPEASDSAGRLLGSPLGSLSSLLSSLSSVSDFDDIEHLTTCLTRIYGLRSRAFKLSLIRFFLIRNCVFLPQHFIQNNVFHSYSFRIPLSERGHYPS